MCIACRGGCGGDQRICGAAGTLDVAVTSRIYTPARIEFAYRRPWEKDVKPIRTLKLIVNTTSITNNIDSIISPSNLKK